MINICQEGNFNWKTGKDLANSQNMCIAIQHRCIHILIRHWHIQVQSKTQGV